MLFACLEGHSKAAVPCSIHTHSNYTTGDIALEFIFSCEESGVGAAKTHGYSNPLGRADGYICSKFTRRSEDSQRQQICRHNNLRIYKMRFLNKSAIVFHAAFTIRVLNNNPEETVVEQNR